MIRLIYRLSDNYSSKIVWIGLFIIVSFITLMVQLVILPYVFPAWHVGDGLLVGGDWNAFNAEAVKMAEEIRNNGWSAWELRPKGWFPAGIAGAVYAVSWPKPWVMTPINAAVHATTVLLVMRILLFIVPKRSTALLAALPFAFFPSAMLWYAQIHRDGYHFFGVMLFIYGLLLIIVKNKDQDNTYMRVMKGFLLSLCGLLLIWLVRPYFVVILKYVYIIILLMIITVLFYNMVSKRDHWHTFLIKTATLALLLMAMNPLTDTQWASRYQHVAEDAPIFGQTTEPSQEEDRQTYRWERIGWLPESIDNQLYSMAYFKAVGYPSMFGEPASAIDYDRTLHNGYDFIFYLPRALQIAFLAPFPNMWLEAGSGEETTMFRRIAMLEMIIIYLVLPFLLIGIWKWRKRFEVWVLFIFCTVIMLPLVYAMPNVGAVYRYRYGYLMLLIGLGLAFLVEFAREKTAEKKALEH